MIRETIVDDNDNELSVHYNIQGLPTITIAKQEGDEYDFQYINIVSEDIRWLINRLETIKSQIDG